jgi:hypothetical protein
MVINDEPKWVREARQAARFELAKEMHGDHVEKVHFPPFMYIKTKQ